MYQVASFYKFKSLNVADIEAIERQLTSWASDLQILGLMILGPEGLNCTVCCEGDLAPFIEKVKSVFGDFEIKWSQSDVRPFRRFKVAIRDEIVTIGNPDLVPNGKHRHLSPEEWEQALHENDVAVIDTRNWYETKVGKFKNAIELPIEEFTEFGQAVEKLGLPKDKKVLMYCTGGIRCEKAILEMERQGFQNVFQLDGGILNYLEKFPNKSWEGECFVFDHRVAVDQDLKPSKRYSLCAHCGQPSTNRFACVRCDAPAHTCDKCLQLGSHMQTCSKNCAYHFSQKPVKGRRQELESGTRRSLKSKRLKDHAAEVAATRTETKT